MCAFAVEHIIIVSYVVPSHFSLSGVFHSHNIAFVQCRTIYMNGESLMTASGMTALSGAQGTFFLSIYSQALDSLLYIFFEIAANVSMQIGGGFIGELDELRIFNVALTTASVISLHQYNDCMFPQSNFLRIPSSTSNAGMKSGQVMYIICNCI